jgi:hypothetical protein
MSVTINPGVGERVELGRYRISSGERVLYGQRVNGVVRITDNPTDSGRAYLVERGLEEDGYAALNALVGDYVEQAGELDDVPMVTSVLANYLRELASGARGRRFNSCRARSTNVAHLLRIRVFPCGSSEPDVRHLAFPCAVMCRLTSGAACSSSTSASFPSARATA